MEIKNKIITWLYLLLILLFITAFLYMITDFMRDHYCFTTPYEEVKESKICEVYFNEK